MAPHNQNDDHNPQRDRSEDNPFIAFRRFADSQVSTLLHGLATLPEWLADYNSVNLAREKCLFGKADPEDCTKLQEVENKIEKMYNNEFSLSNGNLTQATLRDNIERYMKLEASAREIRTRIVEAGRGMEPQPDGPSSQIDLIERVGNQKGQQWGWSWDWGFPKPFDSEPGQQQDQQMRNIYDLQRHDPEYRDPRTRPDAYGDHHRQFHEATDALRQWMREDYPPLFSRMNRPAEEDESDGWKMEGACASFSPYHRVNDQSNRHMASHFGNLFQGSYSPRALENNHILKDGLWRDAFEDLIRLERGSSMIPHDQLGKSRDLPYRTWALRFRNQPHTQPFSHVGDECPVPRPTLRGEYNEEPNYEYGHDHEDQHDDPPTPTLDQGKWIRGTPETELEAYERLLGPTTTQGEASKPSPPSILSTLTTTERTVAPDGTIITRVVLKKRFTDGKEESTETTHTHRGDGQPEDPWKAFHEPEVPLQSKTENPEKKRGWFWSN